MHAATFGGVEGTGRRVAWTGMDLIRFADGRIVELWGNNDALGLFEQLV
jgi:predicted ester cyclase